MTSKTAKEHAVAQDFGPIWQLKGALETKIGHIKEARDTIERSQKNIVKLQAEADEFRAAIAKLENA